MKFDKKSAVIGAFVGAFAGAIGGVTDLGVLETIAVAIIVGIVFATVLNILWK
ncbi:MAG: hypothetical protein PHD13_07510 [Methanocellales archaeon]|nr:hypothetical protein [Methanocellales archaeon]MDD3292417.1 hypothetical protein [Methanocellales archaeon]MDD5236003.1 hypothetical protein [Methanocellales archaeon]MDD5485891.1 hypothetical protein [Methanocellales archaeon]